ncbi:MAG: hypothetical protein AMS20_15770 [Gemmatimonas sp. SG8_28]|nr:MAG: hypothetical protein AMS20_15770 [Gemmatimonas sp. SG8_28]
MRRIALAALVLILVVSVRTAAQMTPQKWENVEWYWLLTWQFTGAEADSASTIFWQHLMPVMEEAWPGTTCLRIMTGDMGVTCFGPMEEGPEGMAWEVSPEDVRFMSLFMEREGEAAMDMFATFGNAATGFEFNIALKHTGGL